MRKSVRRLLCAMLAAAMMLGLTACGSSGQTTAAESTKGSETTKAADSKADTSAAQTTEAAQTTAPAGKTHIVVDHAGNEVEVPNEINRVVVADIYPMASVLTVFFGSAD